MKSKSQIVYIVFLEVFLISVICSVSFITYVLLTSDTLSVYWCFLFLFLSVYPFQIILFLISIIIDTKSSKMLSKPVKIAGWILFGISILNIPISFCYFNTGFEPIYIYLMLSGLYLIFGAFSIANIITYFKRISL